MSTHNICFCGEIRKILCGYPLLSVAMTAVMHLPTSPATFSCNFLYETHNFHLGETQDSIKISFAVDMIILHQDSLIEDSTHRHKIVK